jgi:uncharacterized membrane protein
MAVSLSLDASERLHAADAPRDQRAYRLGSVDMVRGLVIVIMAIDHVRDFFITHFCAPVFVLLAGTSAGLMATRKSSTELAQRRNSSAAASASSPD